MSATYQVTVKLPAEKARLDSVAAADGRTRSGLTRLLLTAALQGSRDVAPSWEASQWPFGLSSAPVCALADDAARRRALAPTCKGCHDISPLEHDLKHSTGGPNLQRVYLSLAGTRPAPVNPTAAFQHPYPPLTAARDAGIVWTDKNLSLYLQGPKAFLNKVAGKSFDTPILYMQFSIGQERERRDVIAYLKAIKDHPECD